jgi:glycopeptide antibiotics resistance protein
VTRTTDVTQRRSAATPSAAGSPLLAGGFAVYLALLVWVVLWKLGTPWVGDAATRVVKLVPFLPYGGAGASEPVELAINLVLFVPFGLYLGLLAPSWSWRKVGGAVAGASVALEVCQYVLAIGSADVSDVLVNIAGGLVGFGVLALARHGHGERARATMTVACTTLTGLAVLAAALFVASPVRLNGPPPGELHRPHGAERSLPGAGAPQG